MTLQVPPKVLLFNRWDMSGAKVTDPGLIKYINLVPVVVPRTGAKNRLSIHKSRTNIVERLITHLMVPGHRGKKHKLKSDRCPASSDAVTLSVRGAFEIIEKKGKDPIQTLVHAIENAALYEEVAAYRLGGIIARQSVVVSPHRRLDLALRYLAQGIYQSDFSSKKTLAQTIADELLAASENDNKSHAIRERQRLEREAEGAR